MAEQADLTSRFLAGATVACHYVGIALHGIWRGLVWFYHWAGKIIVGKCMRAIVKRYDKRHGTVAVNDTDTRIINSSPTSNGIDNSDAHQQQLDTANAKIGALSSQLESLKSQNNQLTSQITTFRQTNQQNIGKLNLAHQAIQQLDKDYKLQIAQLQSTIDSLKSQCVPKDDVPSMVYYAEADSSGQELRRLKTTPTDNSIYRLSTCQGNASVAEFCINDKADMSYIIANRNNILNACIIEGIDANADGILSIESGIVRLTNGRWQVEKQAKIRIYKK